MIPPSSPNSWHKTEFSNVKQEESLLNKQAVTLAGVNLLNLSFIEFSSNLFIYLFASAPFLDVFFGMSKNNNSTYSEIVVHTCPFTFARNGLHSAIIAAAFNKNVVFPCGNLWK